MDSLNIASTGLAAFRQALNTTSHNIANANTEGYSRQRVDIVTNDPLYRAGHYRGSGVTVASITRVSDDYANAQVRDTGAELARLEAYNSLASRIDHTFSSEESSLTPPLQSFFNSVEKLNADPSSSTARTVVISEAKSLADRFNSLDYQLRSVDAEVNARIEEEVGQVNSLAEDLAVLNGKIHQLGSESDDGLPPDLLDQRDQLLQGLSEHLNVRVTQQKSGAVDIVAGHGINLVSGDRSYTIEARPGIEDSHRYELFHEGQSVSSQVSGGSIGGIMDFRNEMLEESRNELGRLATVFATSMNDQHSRGIDLNGAAGQTFFSVAEPSTIASNYNSGTAELAVNITNPSVLTNSTYQLKYDGGNYELERLSDGVTIYSGSSPLNFDGMEINVTGSAQAGDEFLIRPVANGAREITMMLSNANQIAAAAPIRTGQSMMNTGDGSISSPTVTNSNDAALADSVAIKFSNSNDYELVDASGTSISTGTLGVDKTISANGWQVEISGTPASGDKFTVENNSGSTSDNTNSYALTELQFSKTVEGMATFQEGYAFLVNRVGTSTRQSSVNMESQLALHQAAVSRQDSISGVSLDEEAVNLTRYQQAYQAAAQVISTSKTLFNTVLQVVGG